MPPASGIVAEAAPPVDGPTPAPLRSSVGTPLPHLGDCLYLDYNATTPIFPEVAAAMAPFTYECFGNPSSGHAYGGRAAAAVADARAAVARMVNADPSEVPRPRLHAPPGAHAAPRAPAARAACPCGGVTAPHGAHVRKRAAGPSPRREQ